MVPPYLPGLIYYSPYSIRDVYQNMNIPKPPEPIISYDFCKYKAPKNIFNKKHKICIQYFLMCGLLFTGITVIIVFMIIQIYRLLTY